MVFWMVSSAHLSQSMVFSTAVSEMWAEVCFALTFEELGRRIFRSPQRRFCAFCYFISVAPMTGPRVSLPSSTLAHSEALLTI